MKKQKIILFSDLKNEIDDQFALYYALKSPEIELLGLICTQNNRKSGKNSVKIYDAEAKKIIKLAKVKTPIFKGLPSPLSNNHQVRTSQATEFVIKSVLNSKEPVILVGIGPATDLANISLIEPKIKQKAKFIWLGGFDNSREVNFAGDAIAAKILFNANIGLVHIPIWGVTSSLILETTHLIKDLKSKNLPICTYLAQLLENNWQRFGLKAKFIPQLIKRYWIFSDIAAIAVAKNFGIGKTKKENSKTTIERIETQKILAQFQKYILND